MPILWFDHAKTADFGSEKNFFSITIFKKNEFVSKVAPFILSLNHSKRAFVAFGFFLPQQKLLENAKFQLRKLLFDGVPIIGFE